MKKNSAKRKACVQAHSDNKEQQSHTATELSTNLNEAVEKSISKSSSDEVRSTPQTPAERRGVRKYH